MHVPFNLILNCYIGSETARRETTMSLRQNANIGARTRWTSSGASRAQEYRANIQAQCDRAIGERNEALRLADELKQAYDQCKDERAVCKAQLQRCKRDQQRCQLIVDSLLNAEVAGAARPPRALFKDEEDEDDEEDGRARRSPRKRVRG